MLTIGLGFCMHLYRVIFGDDLALQYVVTPTTDMVLMIPMIYAAITGILSYRRMVFANRVHKIALDGVAGLHRRKRAPARVRDVRAARRQLLCAHGGPTGSAGCC